MALEYDPTRMALYSPESRETLFVRGRQYSDLQIAIEAARLAYLRAESQPREQQKLSAALTCIGFRAPAVFHDPATHTEAFAAYRDEDALALIAFRGTQPDAVGDLITDLKFRLIDWPESAGLVHEGFAAAFRSVQTSIGQWLQMFAARRQKLILTGHSLGAALATLGASVWNPTLLVTLGSPRVGNAGFVAALEKLTIRRIVDCCDLVTDVPLEVGGYRHVGLSTYVTRSGEVVENPQGSVVSADRLQADIEYLQAHAWKVGENVLLRRLADHAPINYARAFFRS